MILGNVDVLYLEDGNDFVYRLVLHNKTATIFFFSRNPFLVKLTAKDIKTIL